MKAVRPLFAFILSHALASYVMVAGVALSDPRLRSEAMEAPGEALLTWAFSPLVSPWMLLHWGIPSLEHHPRHLALVYLGYVPTFCLTHLLARRRRAAKWTA